MNRSCQSGLLRPGDAPSPVAPPPEDRSEVQTLPPPAVFAALDSSLSGLPATEVASRTARFGANELPPAARRAPWRQLATQFTGLFAVVLIVASAVTFAAWGLQHPRDIGTLQLAIAILGVVLLNAVIGFVQEYSAERTAESLQAMVPHACRVMRGGERQEVPVRALVPGDVVLLEAGDAVPADCRLKELFFSDRAQLIPEQTGPSATNVEQIASVVLSRLHPDERRRILERAEHVREVLTGYRSGSPELPRESEPRPEYAPGSSLEARYTAKAAELGGAARSVRRWVTQFREHAEAGLAAKKRAPWSQGTAADDRWVETALEVMVEHTGQSKPSRALVAGFPSDLHTNVCAVSLSGAQGAMERSSLVRRP